MIEKGNYQDEIKALERDDTNIEKGMKLLKSVIKREIPKDYFALGCRYGQY